MFYFFFLSSVMLYFSLRILCNYVYTLYEHMYIFMKYFYNCCEGPTNTCVLFYKLTASCVLPDFALALYTQLWFSWKYWFIGRGYERIETTVISYFIERIIIWRVVIRLQRDLNGSDVIMDHISLSLQVFGDYYHFRHRTVVKRSLSDHRGTHVRLLNDPKVRHLFLVLQSCMQRKSVGF